MAGDMSVYLNGKKVGQCSGGSIASARRWVNENVTSTHMGEWFHRAYGFEYATTIGQYYEFRKEG